MPFWGANKSLFAKFIAEMDWLIQETGCLSGERQLLNAFLPRYASQLIIWVLKNIIDMTEISSAFLISAQGLARYYCYTQPYSSRWKRLERTQFL